MSSIRSAKFFITTGRLTFRLVRRDHLLDTLTAELEDPAEVFAASVRLHKTHPQIAKIMASAVAPTCTTGSAQLIRQSRRLQSSGACGFGT